MVVFQHGWLIMEKQILKWMIWGIPYFRSIQIPSNTLLNKCQCQWMCFFDQAAGTWLGYDWEIYLDKLWHRKSVSLRFERPGGQCDSRKSCYARSQNEAPNNRRQLVLVLKIRAMTCWHLLTDSQRNPMDFVMFCCCLSTPWTPCKEMPIAVATDWHLCHLVPGGVVGYSI